MSDSVDTGGGSYIGHATAGTIIGRDQIILISGYSAQQLEAVLPRLREVLADPHAKLEAEVLQERLTVNAPEAPQITLSAQAARDLWPAAVRQADERAYLCALIVNPRYGRWASQFVALSGHLTIVKRPPGWAEVPPEFTELEAVGEGAQRQLRRTRLEDITKAVERHDVFALLGEPGAGKTTTLCRLALEAARHRLTEGTGPFPVLLPLADYRDAASPYAYLEDKWRQRVGTSRMRERLHGGELFLLCDALNEMPFTQAQDYRQQVGAWKRFVTEWPGNHVIFTCRSRDYSEPMGLPQVEIERLDDPRVQGFLHRYLSAEQATEAWSRLQGTPLLALVRNPYYLSMLAYLLAQGEPWPSRRADLFAEFVRTLLRREQQKNPPDWLGVDPMVAALSSLAEVMQPQGEGTRLARQEVLAQLPTRVELATGPVATPPETVVRLGLAASLLDTRLDADTTEQVQFYHHQLQEYFAARALLRCFQAGEDLTGRWRQPTGVKEMPELGPLRDDEPLPPPPASGWEEPTLLAAGLAPEANAFVEAVRQVNPTLAARCLSEANLRATPELVTETQQALLGLMGDRRVHLRTRVAAGEALGRLGDPRFEAVEVNGQRVLLPPLVAIPAGAVRLGSGFFEVLGWRLKGYPAGGERPRHRVTLPAFWIGQYPVTHAEFECFIQAGGYQDEQWWPAGRARAWRRGELENEALEDWMDTWRQLKGNPALLEKARQWGWNPQAIRFWEQAMTWDEEAFRTEIRKRVQLDRPHDQPAFWEDERFNNPSQPVVGVTWFEARAYCRWLDAQWRAVGARIASPLSEGYGVQLPSEAEWEYAARGRWGRRFPWGGRGDPGRANTLEGHVLRPTPVGSYPEGTTSQGIHEMSGNVWEWTRSLYKPYPYRAEDGRENPEAKGPLVVRGGAWGNRQGDARCAARVRYLPVGGYNFRGFRVVVSLVNSGF